MITTIIFKYKKQVLVIKKIHPINWPKNNRGKWSRIRLY
ncbi:hypothetical protein OENI_1160011 [Oenococcus oeni]|nr:hypothetical protein OENI_1160011 [Oenococcus oeni]